MNISEYELELMKLNNKQPAKETPKGQKFNIGDIVTIENSTTWWVEAYGYIGKHFEVQHTYGQKFRNGLSDLKKYSLKHLFEDNNTAWYDESELVLIKSVDDVNEDKDLLEYKRLKSKYEK